MEVDGSPSDLDSLIMRESTDMYMKLAQAACYQVNRDATQPLIYHCL